MNAKGRYFQLLEALDRVMPDTELLDQTASTDRQVRQRMRVLHATAQAMIEEYAGPGQRHPAAHQPDATGKACDCGYRYAKGELENWKHQDKILALAIERITEAVKRNRRINWRDVKEEADSWDQPN